MAFPGPLYLERWALHSRFNWKKAPCSVSKCSHIGIWIIIYFCLFGIFRNGWPGIIISCMFGIYLPMILLSLNNPTSTETVPDWTSCISCQASNYSQCLISDLLSDVLYHVHNIAITHPLNAITLLGHWSGRNTHTHTILRLKRYSR